MKVAVLGGSFDPPHNGHMLIASRLLKLNCFDKIILMPLFQHPFNKKLSHPDKRLAMTRLLENDRIKASDLEIKNKTTSYTINTLIDLSKSYPQDEFYWIIGSDQIKNLTKWKCWKELINKFKLVVIPRVRAEKLKNELKNIKKLLSPSGELESIILIGKKNFPPINISSTLVRKKIKEGKTISKFVPKKIERYIIKHGLYL